MKAYKSVLYIFNFDNIILHVDHGAEEIRKRKKSCLPALPRLRGAIHQVFRRRL